VSTAIAVRDLAKSFRIPSVRRTTVREHALAFWRPRRFETLRVLADVNFEVAAGEAVGIMGRNGCGKSTLLKILAGIYRPDRGSVTVHGGLTPILELGVGWNPELDAVDNILLAGSVLGLTLYDLRARTAGILEFAELERFANLQLKHYSSGMAARLAYAVAFQAVREVLVLDEVFAVGDAGFKQRCETRCRELHEEGRTVVLVSHTPQVVAEFCSRAILLERGKVVKNGPAAEVAAAYSQLFPAET
jgi:ABC-type polysaccharide/polyol phosphate transport system ATPase subunit